MDRMDWPRYKTLCERPNVMPRALLTRTAALLPATLADILRHACQGAPLPKPPEHKGGPETDMFELTLTLTQARAIANAVESGAGRGVAAAWRELWCYIAAGKPAARE